MTTTHSEPNYMAIFWWLLALTILEIGATRLPVSRLIIAILLVGMALTKASLVALYFMHLKFEKKVLTVIAFTPLALCVFLSLMLLPDSKNDVAPTPPPAAAEGEAPPAEHGH